MQTWALHANSEFSKPQRKPSDKEATRVGEPWQQIEVHEEAMKLLELRMGLVLLSARDAPFSTQIIRQSTKSHCPLKIKIALVRLNVVEELGLEDLQPWPAMMGPQ